MDSSKVQLFWKGHKNLKKIPLVLTLLSENNCLVKKGGRFFQIFRPSHNVIILATKKFGGSVIFLWPSEKIWTLSIIYCFQTKLSRRLQFHKMRMHEVVKNNVCHLCGKGFITSSILSTHMKSTHSEVKEFICDKCGSKFNSMTTLYGMAILVVEFSKSGYKIRMVFA